MQHQKIPSLSITEENEDSRKCSFSNRLRVISPGASATLVYSLSCRSDKEASTVSWSKSEEDSSDVAREIAREMMLKEKAVEERTDPTMRIFRAMPKGLEYFMNNGTQATIRLREDETKLEHDERLQFHELKSRHDMLLYRCNFMVEKKEGLVNDIKRFEAFVDDNEKKMDKAKKNYLMSVIKLSELKRTKREADNETRDCNLLLCKLEKKVNSFQPLMVLTKEICERVKMANFEKVMSRHTSLVSTVEYLKQEEELNRTVRNKELEEEQANDNVEYTRKLLMMRQQIINKEKRLKQLKEENKHLKETAEVAVESERANMQRRHLMERSVRNMARTLLGYRTWTERRMTPAVESDDVIAMMAAIGDIITDYSGMLGRMSVSGKRGSRSRVDLTHNVSRRKSSSQKILS